MERLDKLLTATGHYTRSEAKRLISQGRVKVNGKRAKSGAEKYDAQGINLQVDGAAIEPPALQYIMMNKPAGVLSATQDGRGGQTVLDLLPSHYSKLGLFPAGRLDKDSVGLLLLTNDGPLAHSLLHPKHHVEKRYEVTVDGHIEPSDVAAFSAGIGEFQPAELEILAQNRGLVTLQEGKYHQIKRMFASRGKPVIHLKRISMGGLLLDEALETGDFRPLTPQELNDLVGNQSR